MYSENLGQDPAAFQVQWFGRRGMLWEDLIFELGRLYATYNAPDIMILHIGGNDIGKKKTFELISEMKDTLKFLKLVSPNTVFVFFRNNTTLALVKFIGVQTAG